MKKFCKKSLYLIGSLILVAVIYLVCLLYFGTPNNTLINKPVSLLLNEKPRLQDDFYNNINYKYLSKNKLEDDEMIWRYMYSDSSKLIKEEKEKIIDEILKNCGTYSIGSAFDKICIFNDSYDNKSSNNEINYYIDLINNTKTIEEYLNTVLTINKELSIGMIVNPSINFQHTNLKQPYFTLNTIYYDHFVENSEFYSLDSFEQQFNKLKKYDVKLLKLYGMSENEAYKMLSKVHSMYKDIARFSIKSHKILDKGYTVYTVSELQKQLNNINLNLILNKYNDIYNNSGYILVTDINQLNAIDDYLTSDNLDTLKKYSTLRILTEYSDYLGDDYYKLNKEFNETFYGAIVDSSDDQDIKYSLIYTAFQDTIVNEFAKRNFTNEEKVFYTNLILEEIEMFKKRITKEEWLGEDTKVHAMNKMNKMSYTVGYNDLVYAENNFVLTKDNSYLKNVINMFKGINDEMNRQYGRGNIVYRLIDPLEQNAYYEANTNSINILLGMIYSYKNVLNYDVKDLEKHYYELLGTAGATIGHELTHALDSNGSKYDGDGNYINWWTKEDLENFNKLNVKVVKYYNNYEQFGSETLGENIADLGGMALIMDLARKKQATNEEYKTIFKYYTLDWCSQMTPYARSYLIYNDEHSPDKNRVNAVLSSTEEFYSVYEIKEADKMFVPKKNRVSVW